MTCKLIQFLLVSSILALVVSCASRIAPASLPVQPAVSTFAPFKDTWEDNWAAVVKAAQKERTLLAYAGGALSTARESMQISFKEKYGITLDTWIYVSAAEALQRMRAERRAGLKLVDIYFGGAATFLTEMIPEYLVESLDTALILPEVKDSKIWRNGEIPFLDSGHRAVAFSGYVSGNLTVNTNLVKSGEITLYQDMMNSRWKGKILTRDPTIPGSGEKFWTVTGEVHKGWDWVREFVARQEPVITRDMRLAMDWVTQGKVAIVIGVNENTVWDYYQAGAPVGWAVLKDGGYTTVGGHVIGVVKEAPHPDAARVFLNWMLSKEGQERIIPRVNSPSWRLDVSTEGINPILIPELRRKYFNSDSEEFALKYDEFRKLNKQIWSK